MLIVQLQTVVIYGSMPGQFVLRLQVKHIRLICNYLQINTLQKETRNCPLAMAFTGIAVMIRVLTGLTVASQGTAEQCFWSNFKDS